MSRIERAVTYVCLGIIVRLTKVLEVDPAEFFRRPTRSGGRKGADRPSEPLPPVPVT